METNLKFNSAICTFHEQSERLLALGLKKETADMKYPCTTEYYGGILTEGISSLPMIINTEDDEVTECDLPAWSLHRLIEMMPQEIFYEDSTLILGVFGDGVYYADNEYGEVFRSFDGNLYECIIKCIDWLIKEGYINKEYLEEE